MDTPNGMVQSRINEMSVVVIIPTYNEHENIGRLLNRIFVHLPEAHILVIDDGSPDGTGDIVQARSVTDERVHLMRRAGKEGLGTAYIAGFRWALGRNYDVIVSMDADFSHDPAYLPRLVERSRSHDLVVGSRYVPGGATPDWTLKRRVISRAGNIVARAVLGIPMRDCTTAYRCYRRATLAGIDLNAINLVGYGFLIEMAYQCHINGLRIAEIPIVFMDRRSGESKMSRAIVVEALRFVLFRRWQRVRQQFAFGRTISRPPSRPLVVDLDTSPLTDGVVGLSADVEMRA